MTDSDWFAQRLPTVESTLALLRAHGYLPDLETATVVHVAAQLGRPLLVEGPAGTGKTSLATALAAATGSRLVRLQCYEGLDETKVLYEWNYRKQLLWLQASTDGATDRTALEDIFTEEFLLTRPVLDALTSDEPVVLLIDEVDRIEMETEALLLEVLGDLQVSIPELGVVRARRTPAIVLTSNATRDLSEALRRRCVYLWLDYPTPDRERDILLHRVPDASESLAQRVVEFVQAVRTLDLRKRPSIAETIDWARTLARLGADPFDPEVLPNTLGVLLKHRSDIERVWAELTAEEVEP